MNAFESRKEILDIQDAILLYNTAVRKMMNELGALALRGTEIGRRAIVLENEEPIITALNRVKSAIERARRPLRAPQRIIEQDATLNLQWVDLSPFCHDQRLSGEILAGFIVRTSPLDPPVGSRLGTEYRDGLGDRENDSWVTPYFVKFADAIREKRITKYQLAAAVERGVLKDEEADFAILVVNS